MAKHIDTISKARILPRESSTAELRLRESKTVEPTTPDTTTPGSGGTDNYASLFPEPAVLISGPPAWVWWIVLGVSAVVLLCLAIRLYAPGFDLSFDQHKLTSNTPTPTTAVTSPTTTPTQATPTPTAPTPSPTTINKTTITLRILNGSGASGAAASAQATLQQAGFTVRSIGNARSQSYLSTVIYYQTGRAQEAKLVQAALSNYQTSLEESSLADPDMVLVVIGAQ